MQLNEAITTAREYAMSLLSADGAGLEAVAVGRKDRGPISRQDDEEFCVTAFVSKKLTANELGDQGIRPFDALYSEALGGEPPAEADVDVVETGSSFHLELDADRAQRGRFGGRTPTVDTQRWFPDLRTGIGITNPVGEYPNNLSVGTLGFFVQDAGGHQYLVSNNHVIGKSNAARQGEAVVQPGTLDLTDRELRSIPTEAALIGQLEIARVSAVVQIEFPDPSGVPLNRVDGAIAELTNSGRGLDELFQMAFSGGILGVAAPYAVGENGAVAGSDRVYKVGRTTGYTEGVVTNIAGISNIRYPGGRAHFVDQIIVQPTDANDGPFSDAGDSGSGVLNDSHELAGLLFAGSSRHTLVNPIDAVLTEIEAALGVGPLTVITV